MDKPEPDQPGAPFANTAPPANTEGSAPPSHSNDSLHQPRQQEHRYPVEFRGSGSEYFKIWIVNVLLSIVTLYIYSAWAKVRSKRYFYGNTFVDKSSFEYHATGGQILKGRCIAVLILILVFLAGIFVPVIQSLFYLLLFILLPWIIWRSIIFNARMSSYRNVRYGFTKRVGPLYRTLLKCLAIPLLIFALIFVAAYFSSSIPTDFTDNVSIKAVAGFLVFGYFTIVLVIPWLHRNLSQYALNGYRYGTALFTANLSLGKYYWIYISTILLGIGLFLLLSITISLVAVLFKGGIAGITDAEQILNDLASSIEPGSPYFILFVVLLILGYLLLLLISLIPAAYMRCKFRNYRYAQTVAGNRVRVQSNIKTWPLALLLFSNTILLVITLGLAYPWTRVRVARYMAKNTLVISNGTLDHFVAAEEERVSSLGDELGEAFDFDFELGI